MDERAIAAAAGPATCGRPAPARASQRRWREDVRPAAAADFNQTAVEAGEAFGGERVIVRVRTRIHPEMGSGRPEEVIAALADAWGTDMERIETVRERLVLTDDLEGLMSYAGSQHVPDLLIAVAVGAIVLRVVGIQEPHPSRVNNRCHNRLVYGPDPRAGAVRVVDGRRIHRRGRELIDEATNVAGSSLGKGGRPE